MRLSPNYEERPPVLPYVITSRTILVYAVKTGEHSFLFLQEIFLLYTATLVLVCVNVPPYFFKYGPRRLAKPQGCPIKAVP